MGFMKWEPTCGNGFWEKVNKLELKEALGGMEPSQCTENTLHINQKISMRFTSASDTPQISEF